MRVLFFTHGLYLDAQNAVFFHLFLGIKFRKYFKLSRQVVAAAFPHADGLNQCFEIRGFMNRDNPGQQCFVCFAVCKKEIVADLDFVAALVIQPKFYSLPAGFYFVEWLVID